MKQTLLLHPTCTALWHALILEAQQSCTTFLDEELESYLIFLLIRFAEKPEIANSVLGLDFLNGAQEMGPNRHNLLRDVGDKCLLFAGLFPGRASKKHLEISYFVKLGKTAYSTLSTIHHTTTKDLYCLLCEDFVKMMDVLHATRYVSGNDPILDYFQALNLWRETKSKAAYKRLCKTSNILAPVPATIATNNPLH